MASNHEPLDNDGGRSYDESILDKLNACLEGTIGMQLNTRLCFGEHVARDEHMDTEVCLRLPRGAQAGVRAAARPG